MRMRQLIRLVVVSNLPNLVGSVHRAVALKAAGWHEPSPALEAALRFVVWRVRMSMDCLRAVAWT
jgi:hypothetical protein